MGLKKKLHLAKSATTTFWRAFICFFLRGDGGGDDGDDEDDDDDDGDGDADADADADADN